MIISASRRTDLPAFFPEWLMARFRAGNATVRNPRNPGQVREVSLRADAVDGIVFWSKNPAPLLPFLDELDAMGYVYYFQFTLTPYGKTIEPGLPDKARLLQTFRRLSRCVGRGRVHWRYDPILFAPGIGAAQHRAWFAELAEALWEDTSGCTISFLDSYRKLNAVFRTYGLRAPDEQESADLCAALSEIAARYGVTLDACCESGAVSRGIPAAHCVDSALLERLSGEPSLFARRERRDNGQRPGCGCAPSVDIGSYGTCRHGCIYCYAR